jgi:hypothetical protein
LTALRGKIKQMFQGASIGGAGSFLTASLWGAVATGAFKLAQAFREAVDHFRDLRAEGAKLGITTAEMSRLANAADFAGTRLAAATSMLGILRNMEIKAALGSKEAQVALDAVGLSADKLARMDAAQRIAALNEAIKAIPDSATRAAVAMQFGTTPEELNQVASGITSINTALLDAQWDKIVAGWDAVTSSIKQATRAMMAFSVFGQQLKLAGALAGLIPKESAGGNVGNAAAQKQLAQNVAGVKLPSMAAAIQEPVDQMRRIGGFMPTTSGDGMQSQVDVSREILSNLVKAADALRSLDKKTPDMGAKY